MAKRKANLDSETVTVPTMSAGQQVFAALVAAGHLVMCDSNRMAAGDTPSERALDSIQVATELTLRLCERFPEFASALAVAESEVRKGDHVAPGLAR